MAAGRFINVSVAEDERLNGLSIEAQMMYLMAIPHLDRDGLINGNPSALLGKVCPLRPKLASRIPHIINEWVQSAMVVRYANGEGWVLWFRGFAKNNPLTHYTREKASRFPPPPGYARSEDDKGLILEASAAKIEPLQPVNDSSDEVPEESGNLPEESGENPTHVQARARAEVRSEIEIEIDDISDNAASGEESPANEPPTVSERVFDRLAKEWMTVNKTQADNHNALARRYGYDAWLVGFDACSRGQRSNHAYVEKAIVSAIDRNPSLEPAKPKPIPDAKYFYTDPVTGVRREVFM